MTPVLAALVLLAAGPAATPDTGAPPADKHDVLVVGGPGPAVQSSYPASGASVPAGVMILKIVFDKPMKPDAWAYAPVAGADFPKCLSNPRLLSDQRTFVLLCTVEPNHAFALQINPVNRFASDYGRSAQSFTLRFSTTGDETEELHDALKQADLVDADDPIMTPHPAAKGVSETPAPSE